MTVVYVWSICTGCVEASSCENCNSSCVVAVLAVWCCTVPTTESQSIHQNMNRSRFQHSFVLKYNLCFDVAQYTACARVCVLGALVCQLLSQYV